MKKMKFSNEPILLSAKSYDWLEAMLKRNDKRTKLTRDEKALLDGSRKFDDIVKNMAYE